MSVILDIIPNITVNAGGASGADLTELRKQVEANKQAIGDLPELGTTNKESLVEAMNELKGNVEAKADLARIEAIERYIISLEERLSRVDIQIEPTAFLFFD